MSTTTMPNTSELRHAVNKWLEEQPGHNRQALVNALGLTVNPAALDDFLDRPMVPLGTNLRIKLVRFVEGLSGPTPVSEDPSEVDGEKPRIGRPPGSKSQQKLEGNTRPGPVALPEGFEPVVLANYGKTIYSRPGITIHKDFGRSAMNVPLYTLMNQPTAMAFGARWEDGRVAELVLVPCIPETPNCATIGVDRYMGKRFALFFKENSIQPGFHPAHREQDGTWRVPFPRVIEPQFP